MCSCGQNLSHTSAPTKYSWCFSQETRRFAGAGCGLALAHHGARDLTRPRGGGETGASGRRKGRGSSLSCDLSPAACTSVALSSLIMENHTAQKKCAWGRTWAISDEPCFSLLDVNCSIVPVVVRGTFCGL